MVLEHPSIHAAQQGESERKPRCFRCDRDSRSQAGTFRVSPTLTKTKPNHSLGRLTMSWSVSVRTGVREGSGDLAEWEENLLCPNLSFLICPQHPALKASRRMLSGFSKQSSAWIPLARLGAMRTGLGCHQHQCFQPAAARGLAQTEKSVCAGFQGLLWGLQRTQTLSLS